MKKTICLNRMNLISDVSDAKLRRNLPDSKKYLKFFSNLCGQTPDFWTNQANALNFCPLFVLFFFFFPNSTTFQNYFVPLHII